MDVRQTKNYGDKTEFLIFGATQQLLKINSSTLRGDITDIKPVFEVRTLGSWVLYGYPYFQVLERVIFN